MMHAVAMLMSRSDINAARALVDGVMVFNLILRGDWLSAEVAYFHIAIP
jgi:hypothetical protein